MKGFLWSRKSSTSSNSKNENISNNKNVNTIKNKEHRKYSSQLSQQQHILELSKNKTRSSSSTSLSTLTQNSLSNILPNKSNSNHHHSESVENLPSYNSKQSHSQPHSQSHSHLHQQSRKSSIISKESYLRNSSSQPVVSLNTKNNSLFSFKNHSTISVVSRGSTHHLLPKNDDTNSVLLYETVNNHNNSNIINPGIDQDINNAKSTNNIDTDPDLLNSTSLKNNDKPANITIRLNNKTYDSTIFKSDWINKSHGQITINNPNYHNQSGASAMSPSSSGSLNTDKHSSKRESRFFSNYSHNNNSSSKELLISGPHNITDENDSSIQRPESYNNNNKNHFHSQSQSQQIIIPDYRLYRAQLKGSVFSLYKNGVNNNIKCFDPNLPPENNNVTNNDTIDRSTILSTESLPSMNTKNKNNSKRATIAGSLSSVQNSSTTTIDDKITNSSSDATTNCKIKYLNDKFPHPDLIIDPHTDKIIDGSLESLCHTILFHSHTDNISETSHLTNLQPSGIDISNLLLILPLINDFIKFLTVFNQFGLTFTKNNSKIALNSTQYFHISKQKDALLTDRLALVVKTVLNTFPGFLLSDEIFQATITLLDTISLHNDEISNSLKIAVANKYNELNKLTYFIRPNSSDKSGNLLKINPKLLDELLDINKFLSLDTKTFANNIHLINLKFDKVWAPRLDYLLLYSSKYIDMDITILNPLVFNNSENVHFLGRLLICHLFPSHKTTLEAQSNTSAHRNFISDARTRAKVLIKWVQLGCRLEQLGDMVSWLTIATIVCSIPILRLSQSWQYVPESILKIIFKDWVPTIVQLDRRQMSSKSTSSVFILAPPNLEEPYIRENVISYFGDLIVIADDLPNNSALKYLEKKVNRTKNAFHKWQQRLETIDKEIAKKGISINKNSEVKENDPSTDPLYQFWKYHTSQPKLNITKIMQISLEYEPPLVNQEFYSIIGSQRSSLLTGSYLPIVFNELLPNYTLFPRKSLVEAAGNLLPNNNNLKLPPPRSSARISKALVLSEAKIPEQIIKLDFESNPITGVENIEGPLIKELMSTPSTKHLLMKSIRDMFNINMDMFHISNDLVFKTSVDTIEDLHRPSSVFIESPKRFSQHSLKLNSRDSVDTTSRLSKTLENLDFFKDSSNSSDILDTSAIDVVVKSASLEKLYDLLVLTAGSFSKLIDTKDLENYCYHRQNSSTSKNTVGLLDFALAKLSMDNDTFRETFFNTYKSFTTTLNVLENLAKRFVGAKSCAMNICNVIDSDTVPADSDIQFPVWDADVPEDSNTNEKYIIKIQIGTAEALLHLISNHYTDFTDNIECHTTVLDILKIMEQEIIIEWPKRLKVANKNTNTNTKDAHNLTLLLEELTSLFNNIKSHYQKQLYRPVGISKMKKKIIEQLSSFRNLTFSEFSNMLNEKYPMDSLTTDFKSMNYRDYSSIYNWVCKLDKIFTDAFTLTTKQDWIATYEYLELLSKESLISFFQYPLHSISKRLINTGSSQLKEMQISNIFLWLSTISNVNNQSIFSGLASSLQLLFIIHQSLTSFFLAEITDVHKQHEDRINTCALILQILNYVRWKNNALDLFNLENNNDISPHIPSFIESAICNSIVSVESRFFEYAWSLAGSKLMPENNRNQGRSIKNIIENIDPVHIRNFLEIDNIYTDKNSKNLCPCPGWFICRLLDISQYVPNMDTSNSKLINFDKRRFVNNIVSNVFSLIPNSSKIELYNNLDTFRTGWAKILFNKIEPPSSNLKKKAYNISLDKSKAIKFQESGLFNGIIGDEVDKIRREERKLELLKEQEKYSKVSENITINSKYAEKDAVTSNHLSLNSSMTTLNPSYMSNSSGNKNKRNSVAPTSRNHSTVTHSSGSVSKKIGGFFRRPFSIAGFNTSTSNYSLNNSLVPDGTARKVIQPDLLPDIEDNELEGLKPVLTLKTFEIKNIMEVINHKNNMAYIHSFKIVMQDGDEYMIQAKDARELKEWIRMLNLSKRYSFYSEKFKGKTHNKVFGVPLECICEREGTLVPTIVMKLLEEIELRGLDEVGLYRIPGSVGSINALKNAFDEEGAVNTSFTLEDDRWFEINAIAGCFKMYLRELPDSLFSNKIEEFANLVLNYKSNNPSYETYKTDVSNLLLKLPACYYHTMKRIVLHLNKVHQHVENNRMDASNLAIVFSMSFIDQDDLARCMGATLGAIQTILQQFIKSPQDFFI